MTVPDKITKPGAKPKYKFSTLEVGIDNGIEHRCKEKERDTLLNSLRSLCRYYGIGGKVFKCYPTSLGVFYYRES